MEEDFKWVEEILNQQEKSTAILLFLVKNHIQEIIRATISDLRKKGEPYSAIGQYFGGLKKGTIFQIEKGSFFPKNPKKRADLLKKALERL